MTNSSIYLSSSFCADSSIDLSKQVPRLVCQVLSKQIMTTSAWLSPFTPVHTSFGVKPWLKIRPGVKRFGSCGDEVSRRCVEVGRYRGAVWLKDHGYTVSDPEQADLFYVPLYLYCASHVLRGNARGSIPLMLVTNIRVVLSFCFPFFFFFFPRHSVQEIF